MRRLTVYYDARCGLCCATRDWISRQPQLVPLSCQPASEPGSEIRVTADSGEVWEGDEAWIVVLWALRDYRGWSRRLARPSMLPLARAMFAQLSKYRGTLSCSLGLEPEVR
jgi:predicted DCC family thiol-disulfide oxidoreductase YuxK